jgi:hypothetical protein
VDIVCDTIDDEIKGLKELFKSPPSELSQKKLICEIFDSLNFLQIVTRVFSES